MIKLIRNEHLFPAVCIRTSTERPEALDKACFVLAGIDEESLLQAVDTAVQMNLEMEIMEFRFRIMWRKRD